MGINLYVVNKSFSQVFREDRIIKLLRDLYPSDIPIKEIASKLNISTNNISTNTASKYIAVLEARV